MDGDGLGNCQKPFRSLSGSDMGAGGADRALWVAMMLLLAAHGAFQPSATSSSPLVLQKPAYISSLVSAVSVCGAAPEGRAEGRTGAVVMSKGQ